MPCLQVLDLLTPNTSGRSPYTAPGDTTTSPDLSTDPSSSSPTPTLTSPPPRPDLNSNPAPPLPPREPPAALTDVTNNNRPASASRGVIGFTVADAQVLDSLLKRLQHQKGSPGHVTAPSATFDDSVLSNTSNASLTLTDKWLLGDTGVINGFSNQSALNSNEADPADAVNMNVVAAAAATAMANMNLKRLSPQKRHSSTSAELLKQKEAQRSLTRISARDTMSSASESRLVSGGRPAKCGQQTVSASNFSALKGK